ncbi:GuaB3 family IMP dehydrogenase-related protein [Corynebacterium sp.]|jgi:IMP dehydrogenase|uniref:GuaB3 family IMP dehydrogenase-related protein n=1 Tax=Corynebacterium sp. TaxID=1720 RepID=UPI0025BAF1D1|nr:GuaB3 family IMP dehydrogenase-related protein [Corynebacterium sp.]
MQDQVSIGMGRTARRVFGLDQVDIVPSRRTRSSHDVDTTWKIDAYRFDIPVMSHPSDAVVTPEFAIEFGKLGGLPVINAEGLWGRQADLEGALEKVRTAAGGDDPLGVPEPDFAAQAVLQELHSVPVDAGLLTERIAQVRDSGVTFGVRVSPQHARELAPALIRSGLDLLVIQGTLISAQHVYSDGEPLDLRDFVGSLDAPVIAGGVVDYSTAKHLMRTGVAGVIVGAGTTTNTSTLGIDVPMATAISDAAAARLDYLDETGGRYVHVIADSELQSSGDIAKSIACGADAVSLGAPLALAESSGGHGYFWPSVAAHPQLPRGEVDAVTGLFGSPSTDALPLEKLLFGPTDNPYGRENLVGGLKRSMAKCGYTDLKSFQKAPLVVR